MQGYYVVIVGFFTPTMAQGISVELTLPLLGEYLTRLTTF